MNKSQMLSCQHCGKGVMRYPSSLKHGRRPYCSRACKNADWQKRPSVIAGGVLYYENIYGYLVARPSDFSVRLNRVVWTAANGPIPDGYHIHHLNHDRSDNRLCNLVAMSPSDHSRLHNPKVLGLPGSPRCTVAGCNEERFCKSVCRQHYRLAYRKRGSQNAAQSGILTDFERQHVASILDETP